MFPEPLVHVLNTLPLWMKFGKMMKIFIDTIVNEMKRRREQNVQRSDFLAYLIPNQKDLNDPANKDFVEIDELGDKWLTNGLTQDEIVGQSTLFFLAGYETIATTLNMALFALTQNPDVQEKLYQVLRETYENESQMSLESLSQVKYLEMVINETLRCYTPLLRVDRMCTADTEINGLRIPKGVGVVIPVNAVCHDPDYWPEPDKFDPERFADSSSYDPNAFIPFGAGNRNCIGMRLAQNELRIALAKLVYNFKFTLAPETVKELPIRWKASLFRVPHCPIMVTAERR